MTAPTDPPDLTRSSAKFAHSALKALPEGDYAVFALHAGTALEHLAKAVLSSHHPALIAANDLDSLLHACGESAAARSPIMRTINVTESIQRASRFVPRIGNLETQLKRLCEARNGVAHLGHTDQPEELRLPFLKASEYLRDALGYDRGEYWGEYIGLVDAALEESVRNAKVRVENAIAAARVEFRNRYGHLDEDARGGVIHAIEVGYDPEKYEEEIVECPACTSPALTSGVCETRWEQDDEFSGSILGTYFPSYLRCRVCNLELDGEDELREAGMESEWGIEVDEADFYERDWD